VLFSVVPLASLALSSSKFLPGPAATGVAGAGNAARARGGIRELLADPNLRKLWIGCAVFEGAWAAFSFLLPLYGTRLGLSASTLGLIAGTAGFTLFVVRALMTPLLRRFTPWQLIIIGMVLVGAGHGLLAAVTVPLWMAVGAGLLGVGQGLCSPMVNAQIYESAAAERKGESLALRAFISTGAQGAVPVLAGPLSALITIPGVFVLVTLASLGSALYSRVEWRHRRRSPRGA
jgi:predicted MFS family arabinose efflux permease